MPLDLGTLDGLTPYALKIALQKIQAHANNLEATAKSTAGQVSTIPAPLTLSQINAGLSATGSNPLNLTGLVGTSAATAALASTVASGGGGGTPTPTPNPVPIPGGVTTPPGGPGQAAGDFIDFSTVIIENSVDVSNLAVWPSTGIVSQMAINSSGFSIVFDKQATWPNVPPGDVGTIQYTLWGFVNITGQWYASGVIPFGRGVPTSGGPPSAMGVNWWPTADWGPMIGYQPAVGETVGFMVTAGNERNNATEWIVQERSNIVTLSFPADSGTIVNYSPPTPGVVNPADLTKAQNLINATAAAHPELLAVFPTDDEATNAAIELLRRIIYAETNSGPFLSGRQRNPSGLISNDKFTITFSGAFHAYDIFTLGFAGTATVVHAMNEVGSPNYVADPGIPP